MRRIALFLATNLAVLVVLGTVMNLLEPWLVRQGINVNNAAILIIAVVFGMGGAFVSLLISKKLALMSTRAKVIESRAMLRRSGSSTPSRGRRKRPVSACPT